MSCRYNRRAKEWNKHGMDDYHDLVVKASVDGMESTMMETHDMMDAYYPVYDSCRLEGDPETGCVSTKSLFYSTPMRTKKGDIPILITHNNQIVVNETVSTVMEKKAGVRELECNHNTYASLFH